MENRFTTGPRTRLLAGLAAVLLSLAFCLTAWGQAWERFVFDFLFLMRGPLPAPPEVVIVAIDEPSLAVIEKQWPWPRSLHAQLIDRLFESGAKAVALDIIFAEPSETDEDGRLFDAVRRSPNIILAADRHVIEEATYAEEMIVKPLGALVSPHTRVGLITLPIDADGFVRRVETTTGELPPFALVAAAAYCGSEACPHLTDVAKLPRGVDLTINFLGPPRTIRTVSYYQALEPGLHLPSHLLKDKLVFVGLATQSAFEPGSRGREHHPTPFSRWGQGFMAGVEIHAHLASNLIHNDYIRELSVTLMALAGLVIGLFTSFLFFRLRLLFGGLLLILGVTISVVLALLLFSRYFIYAPMLYVLIPMTSGYLVSPFVHYVEAWREKNFIRKAFSSYLAPSVVDRLLDEPGLLCLGGCSVEATVLVADLAGFTSLSEQLTPERVVDLLNRFLGKFTEIIFQHEGMVDKYIGDEVMAVWGVPIAQPDHAKRACLAALAMLKIMEQLAQAEKESSGVRVRVRIGINSGTMIAGNVGASQHFNYTVVGSDVNHAFRLEGVNKVYDTTIIVGGKTASIVKEDFELRELDIVRVKGEEYPVRTYELQGLKGTLSQTQVSVNKLFAVGLELYRKGNWTEAREVFEKGLRLDSSDGPSFAYSERCLTFEEDPPPADWDGVFSMLIK